MRSPLLPAALCAVLLTGCALAPAASSSLRATQGSQQVSDAPAEQAAPSDDSAPAGQQSVGDGVWPTDHNLFDAVVVSLSANAEPGSFALAVAAPFQRWQASDDVSERRFLDAVRTHDPDFPAHILDAVEDATDTGPVRGAFAHPLDGGLVVWTIEALPLRPDDTVEGWLSGRRGAFLELAATRDSIEPTSDDDVVEVWTTDHGVTVRRAVAERRHDLGWIVSVHLPTSVVDTDGAVGAYTATLEAFTTPGIQEAP